MTRRGLELDDETLAALGGGSYTPARPATAKQAHGVAGVRIKKMRVADGKYLPRGWRFETQSDGRPVLRQVPVEFAAVTAEDVQLLQQTIATLRVALGLSVSSRPVTAADVQRVAIDAPLLEAVRRFYREVHGFDFGEAWRFWLANEIRLRLRILTEQRLGRQSGHVLATPKQMLEKVVAMSPDPLPSWLTPDRLAAILKLETVNLGGSGGRGRRGGTTPEGLIRQMMGALSAKRQAG